MWKLHLLVANYCVRLWYLMLENVYACVSFHSCSLSLSAFSRSASLSLSFYVIVFFVHQFYCYYCYGSGGDAARCCNGPVRPNIETFKFISPFNGYFARSSKHFQTGYCCDDKTNNQQQPFFFFSFFLFGFHLNRGQSVKAQIHLHISLFGEFTFYIL